MLATATDSFEVLYKQSVVTEDVFLGLSDKDPSFASCNALVVHIECPRRWLEDIELDVKKHKLLLQPSTLCVYSQCSVGVDVDVDGMQKR